jgi:hypothetical protein
MSELNNAEKMLYVISIKIFYEYTNKVQKKYVSKGKKCFHSIKTLIGTGLSPGSEQGGLLL